MDWLQILETRKALLNCGWFDALVHLPCCWMRAHGLSSENMHVQIHVHAVSVIDVIATHTCTPEIICIICSKDASNALSRVPSACIETHLALSATTFSIPLKKQSSVGLQSSGTGQHLLATTAAAAPTSLEWPNCC